MARHVGEVGAFRRDLRGHFTKMENHGVLDPLERGEAATGLRGGGQRIDPESHADAPALASVVRGVRGGPVGVVAIQPEQPVLDRV
jgi:hypothetical protein